MMHYLYVLLAGFVLGVVLGVVIYWARVAYCHYRVQRLCNSNLLNGYTHWDIHALAREMDPGAWAAFDALPEVDSITGQKKDYSSFEPVKASFNMAVQALLSGYKAPWPHIFGDKELRKHIALRAVDRAG